MKPAVRVRALRFIGAVLAVAVVTTACGSLKSAGVGHQLAVPELKYRLIDHVGRPLFCGPPVVRVPSPTEAQQEVAALRASDPSTFAAIVHRLHLDATQLTTDGNRLIIEQADVLNALPLQSHAPLYGFDYIAAQSTPEHVAGTIDGSGAISIVHDNPTTFPGPGGCPICLAAQDLIATPNGAMPVTRLRPGTLVWTLDAAGRRVAAPVLLVSHTPAPLGHRVVRLVLADGRVVEASPGHPTADGRHVGDLTVGDRLDGSRVRMVEFLPYVGDTWDLLPAGPSHEYWADGVLLGSTLTTTA